MPSFSVRLARVDLPEFGLPALEPVVPPATYEARIAAARQRAADAGLDALLVYGDREHFANLAYLTRYDPRFEEALLILSPDRDPALLVGNEGMGYVPIIPVPLRPVLYQPFSLLSQPRDHSPRLDTILRAEGLRSGMRVGIAGWKYYLPTETDSPESWVEAPAFLVDTLRGLGCVVVNATALFMEPQHGLRAVNDVDQLAVFEYAATVNSQGVRSAIFAAHPGMTEYELVQAMAWSGIPLNYHPVVFSGERTRLGLASPSSRRLAEGDPVFAAMGVWGTNTARGGFLVRDSAGLDADIRDYVDRLVAPYFRAVVEWYRTLRLGVTGGELYDAVHGVIGDPFFGVALNPGHLIHLDEWVSSPIYQGSTQPMLSGMAVQVDVIPATGTRYFTTNIEDTIALADDALRASFEQQYPEAWSRIQRRRAFMKAILGIDLAPEVLPFSNMPAYLPPYWLSPDQAMVVSAASDTNSTEPST